VGYAFNTAWRGGKGDATLTFEDYKGLQGLLCLDDNVPFSPR